MDLPPAAPVASNPDRRVWIGCSGYAYKHWRGPFYPPDLPTTRWLAHYVRFFPTVELNNTYYTLPGAATFDVLARQDAGRASASRSKPAASSPT